MNFWKRILAIVVAVIMLAACIGCSKEGPAEKAGKEMDKAVEKAKKIFE